MGDGIGQFNEAPLIEEKHESSMRLLSPPAASPASQVLLAAGARSLACPVHMSVGLTGRLLI